MELLDPLPAGGIWDRRAGDHPEATVFHTSAWARVLHGTYGHRPFYYLAQSVSTAGSALIPLMGVKSPLTGHRGVCLPFSDACGPLLPEGMTFDEIRSPLEALARARGWKYLELRGRGSFAPAPPGVVAEISDSPPPGPVPSSTFLGHRLDLFGGVEALWNQLDGSVRRAIRKSEKAGLVIQLFYEAQGMETFFKLHTLTRQRHGLPPQPMTFFRNLVKEKLIAPGAGFVVTASLAGRPVAASVFLRSATTALYKFGASDESAWESRPNHPVMWEAIRHLAQAGVETLDFGRTDAGQEGLKRFKKSWGATEEPIFYSQFLPSAGQWQNLPPPRSRNWVNGLFRMLPLTVNAMAGRLLYPHLD